MIEYPRFVYISPGKNACEGGSFDCELVRDEKEHKAALSAGFADSVPDALDSVEVVKETIEPATRRGRPPKVS
jgi:hypothetical protein